MARTVIGTSVTNTANAVGRISGFRAVIFDMDGVLIDSHPAHRKAWKEFLTTLNRDVTDSELNCILNGHKRQDILRALLGDLSDEQVRFYGNQKDHFFQRIAFDVKPVPGVVDFIRRITSVGIAVAIATSASKLRTLRTLDRLAIARYFSVVVTGDDVERGK